MPIFTEKKKYRGTAYFDSFEKLQSNDDLLKFLQFSMLLEFLSYVRPRRLCQYVLNEQLFRTRYYHQFKGILCLEIIIVI